MFVSYQRLAGRHQNCPVPAFMGPSERDKRKPPVRGDKHDAGRATTPEWEELREQLERASWINYVKLRQQAAKNEGQRRQQDDFLDKAIPETLHEINQRIEELARQYERTVPGDARRESIANEISALQLRLQNLHKKNPK